MAALEAVMGQLYLTVLVARLVGLHIVHGSGSRFPTKLTFWRGSPTGLAFAALV
jgi:hypothetical protein